MNVLKIINHEFNENKNLAMAEFFVRFCLELKLFKIIFHIICWPTDARLRELYLILAMLLTNHAGVYHYQFYSGVHQINTR